MTTERIEMECGHTRNADAADTEHCRNGCPTEAERIAEVARRKALSQRQSGRY